MSTQTFLLAASIIVSLGTARAADKIRYEDLSRRLAPFGSVLEHRSVDVVAVDGKIHHTRTMLLDSDHVRLFRDAEKWEDVASGEIARIEIRQTGRFSHHIL
jgi:hypothetical protein